jgi:aspartyl/asparaginyl-tRNA synthetase
MQHNQKLVNPQEFHAVAKKLRQFFETKGYVEVPAQARLSILAACEDPTTIATFDYIGKVWPLPQTSQMWLEYHLLNDKRPPGYFCMSTSYRAEPNPIPDRHDLIFPMFEFESKGGMKELELLETELLDYLGFAPPTYLKYEDLCEQYSCKELTHEHERMAYEQYGDAVFFEYFPQHTSPFWNMKFDNGIANKIDVILCGQETIGSAERSCDVEQMRHYFNTISNGAYANTLFSRFGKERVLYELEGFLQLPFFPRFGGGIGVTRLMRALKLKR